MTDQQKLDTLIVEFSQDGELISPRELLQRAAQKWPEKVALITDELKVTYAELYAQATALSRHLMNKGIKPGDHVGILFGNSINFYIAYYGAWQTGAVIIPLNTFLMPIELAQILEHAKPALLIGEKARFDNLQVPLMDEDELTQVVAEQNESHSNPFDFKIPKLHPNALATLPYTSGTTGFPKGVMLSSHNIIMNVLQSITRIPLTKDESVLALLPLFHSFAQLACVWGPIAVGGSVVVAPRIERSTIAAGLAHKPTIFVGVPTLFGVLALMKTADVSSIRYFVSGGDALSDQIRSAFELIYRRKLCNGYGLTEASPVVAAELIDELVPTNCIGTPLPGIECSFRDEQDNEVPKGEIGILWVKGPNVMLGYYESSEQTEEVIKNGWLNTGDFAYVDEEGRLNISGRFKDLIISKGINIYPQEIENVLLANSAVALAAVVGKPDHMVGEIPVAFVQLRTPLDKAEELLRQWCSRSLAPYKVPRDIYIVEKIPMNQMGKIDKKKLVAELKNMNHERA